MYFAVTCQPYERSIKSGKKEKDEPVGLYHPKLESCLQKHVMGRHHRPHRDRMGDGGDQGI